MSDALQSTIKEGRPTVPRADAFQIPYNYDNLTLLKNETEQVMQRNKNYQNKYLESKKKMHDLKLERLYVEKEIEEHRINYQHISKLIENQKLVLENESRALKNDIKNRAQSRIAGLRLKYEPEIEKENEYLKGLKLERISLQEALQMEIELGDNKKRHLLRETENEFENRLKEEMRIQQDFYQEREQKLDEQVKEQKRMSMHLEAEIEQLLQQIEQVKQDLANVPPQFHAKLQEEHEIKLEEAKLGFAEQYEPQL